MPKQRFANSRRGFGTRAWILLQRKTRTESFKSCFEREPIQLKDFPEERADLIGCRQ
jgi:hypothetical protein